MNPIRLMNIAPRHRIKKVIETRTIDSPDDIRELSACSFSSFLLRKSNISHTALNNAIIDSAMYGMVEGGKAIDLLPINRFPI